MDPKLWFWAGSLADLALVVALAFLGWRAIRRGETERHRRLMNAAIALVGLFLLAYLAKLAFLGRETLAAWSPADVTLLRVHESIVAVMLVAGATARLLARRHPGPAFRRARHRLAGRVALVAGALAFVTAAMILAGMLERAGPA